MWIPDAMKPRMIKEEWIYHSGEKPSQYVVLWLTNTYRFRKNYLPGLQQVLDASKIIDP